MTGGELKVLFKAVQDTSVRKVIDNIKGEVRSLNPTMAAVSKKMGGDIFTGMSESFKKLNPELFKAGQSAGDVFSKGFKNYALKDLPKMFNGPALPDVSKFLPKGKDSKIVGLQEPTGADLAKVLAMGEFGAKTIKGLRDISGSDLAKVMNLGDISEIGRGSIKGLRETGGADLAKVQALPDINDLDKKTGGAFTKMGIAFGKLGLAVLGISTGFIALKKTIQSLSDAFESARQRYAKSLTSGLGISFSTQRSAIAQVLGVSETDIFKFGFALNYLSPRLASATKILSETTIPLTKVSWEINILKLNMSAMFAKIANEASPAIYSLIKALNDLVSWTTNHAKDIAKPFNEIAKQNQNESKFKAFEEFAKKYNLFIGGQHIKGVDDIGTEKGANLFKTGSDEPYTKALQLFLKEWNLKNGEQSKNLNIPPPQSQMNQLPVGAFEKMGLIIGGGMADKALEIQRRTAVATEKLVHLAMGQDKQKSGFYMSRNPQVAGF